jgi:Lsr2
MAQKVVTVYTDDLTGEESTETTAFRILVNDVGVEVDLTPESHDRLMEALEPFLQAKGARRVRSGGSSGSRRLRGAAGKMTGDNQTADIRAWAKENGFEVNDRGRVPATIREAYAEAH